MIRGMGSLLDEFRVRTALRLVAVVTIFVGLILAARSLLAVTGLHRALGGLAVMPAGDVFPGDFGPVVLLADGVVCAAGALLFALSGALSRRIVG